MNWTVESSILNKIIKEHILRKNLDIIYEYDGTKWKILSEWELCDYIQKIVPHVSPKGINFLRYRLAKFKIASVVIQMNSAIKYCIPFKNATYDLTTNLWRNSSPEDFFTKIFDFNISLMPETNIAQVLTSMLIPNELVIFFRYCLGFLRQTLMSGPYGKILYIRSDSQNSYDFILWLLKSTFD